MGKKKKSTGRNAGTWIKKLTGKKDVEKGIQDLENILESINTVQTITLMFSKNGLMKTGSTPGLFNSLAGIFALELALTDLSKILAPVKERLITQSAIDSANKQIKAKQEANLAEKEKTPEVEEVKEVPEKTSIEKPGDPTTPPTPPKEEK